MTQPAPVVFLLDVDNTLLDNNSIVADLLRYDLPALLAATDKLRKVISSRKHL